jgi:hypothetical protein
MRTAATAPTGTSHCAPNPTGPGYLKARLTPACLALWQAALTPLAKKPATDPMGGDPMGGDPRTPGQRWHDAFEAAGKKLLASGDLPNNAGVHTKLIITIDLKELEQRIGRATTHHGGTLTIDEALRLAAGQEVLPVVLGDGSGILAYGRKHRLATTGQRDARFAQDRGRSFPECAKPAAKSITSPTGPTAGKLTSNPPRSPAHSTTTKPPGWAGKPS